MALGHQFVMQSLQSCRVTAIRGGEMKKFCYVCQLHHVSEDMMLFHTRSGVRWRCKKTVRKAQLPQQQRDEFGQLQSQMNRAQNLEREIYIEQWRRVRGI